MDELYDCTDVAVRLSSVLFDAFWSMLSSPNAMARKLDKVRRQSGGSVVSASTAASPADFKDSAVRLEMLQTLLSNAADTISDSEYTQIVTTCLKASDLYPGFKDCFVIIDHLLRKTRKNCDVNLTPSDMFRHIFIAACDILTDTTEGLKLLKLVCTPTTTQQPQFRICRNRFCHALSDRCDYIEMALETMCDGGSNEEEEEEEEIQEEEEEEIQEVQQINEDTLSMLEAETTPVVSRAPSVASVVPNNNDDAQSVVSKAASVRSRTASVISQRHNKSRDDDNVSVISKASTVRSRMTQTEAPRPPFFEPS